MVRRSSRIAKRGVSTGHSFTAEPHMVDSGSPTPSGEPEGGSPTPLAEAESGPSRAIVEYEQRSKRNEEREAGLVHFRSLAEKRRYEERYNKRRVSKGRAFDWEYLASLGFPYLQRFQEWRWKELITMNRPVYENAVKFFFFNGSLDEHDEHGNRIEQSVELSGFHTFLQRTHLHIKHEDVWEALGRPRHHPAAPKYSRYGYNHLEGARRVYANPALTAVPSTTSALPFQVRILHLVICQNINPRQGNFGGVSLEDIWLMDSIISNNPPNLAAWVMQKLKRTISYNRYDGNRGLLFGRLVSEIIDRQQLQGFHDTTMDNRTPVPFGPKTINMTGFTKDPATGEWVKGNGLNRPRQPGEEGEDDMVEGEEDGDEEMQVRSEEEGEAEAEPRAAEEEEEEEEEEEKEEEKEEEEEEEERGEEEGIAEGGDEEDHDFMDTEEGGRGEEDYDVPVDAVGQGPTAPDAYNQSVNENIQALRDEVRALRMSMNTVEARLSRVEQEQIGLLARLRAALREIRQQSEMSVHQPPRPIGPALLFFPTTCASPSAVCGPPNPPPE